MKIISRGDGHFTKKSDGTEVVYHVFSEFEIHYNELPPATIQQWHHHNIIEEVLYIISGKVEAMWHENGEARVQTVTTGDIVRVQNTPHTFTNPTNETATLVVFRFVPTGGDKREIFLNDKHLD
jgi:uncharacterized RmlC-like cupin family protein